MTTHLLALRVQDYGPIELFEAQFNPAGGVTVIAGQNEAGKSSVLDALESLISGQKAPKKVDPVRQGADEAVIIGTFTDLVVKRVYKANGSTQITAQSADGRKYSNTGEVLKALYEHIALDVYAFARLSEAEQVNTLLRLIGVDLAAFDAEYAAAYAARTPLTARKDSLASQVNNLPQLPSGLPIEPVSQIDLSEQLAVALGKNAVRAQLAEKVERAGAETQRLSDMVTQLERGLAVAKGDLEASNLVWQQGREELANTAPIDTEAIHARIRDAEAINAGIRQREDQVRVRQEQQAALLAWKEADARVEKARADKAAALAAAPMPVPGLSIDPENNVLLLNGTAFADSSTGVRMRTGALIGIALNPNLRLLLIRDAANMDANNQRIIDEIAKANDFSVLMEIAGVGPQAFPTLVIAEGHVAEVRP